MTFADVCKQVFLQKVRNLNASFGVPQPLFQTISNPLQSTEIDHSHSSPSSDSSFFPGSYAQPGSSTQQTPDSYHPSDDAEFLTPEAVSQIYQRIVEIKQLLSNEREIQTIIEQSRSISPPPEYDSNGMRTNSREQRFKGRLNQEYKELAEKVTKNAARKAGLVLTTPKQTVERRSFKLFFPLEDHPETNYMGFIIGPRGSNLKRLEKACGNKTQLLIRGEGTLKEGKQYSEDCYAGSEEPMHLLVRFDGDDAIEKQIHDFLQKEIDAASSDEPWALELKKAQMRELAKINGVELTQDDSAVVDPNVQAFLPQQQEEEADDDFVGWGLEGNADEGEKREKIDEDVLDNFFEEIGLTTQSHAPRPSTHHTIMIKDGDTEIYQTIRADSVFNNRSETSTLHSTIPPEIQAQIDSMPLTREEAMRKEEPEKRLMTVEDVERQFEELEEDMELDSELAAIAELAEQATEQKRLRVQQEIENVVERFKPPSILPVQMPTMTQFGMPYNPLMMNSIFPSYVPPPPPEPEMSPTNPDKDDEMDILSDSGDS
ncbi:putative Branchpoint-bridging protein [Blattamonas nauphoetae]|uniref:Branchpoint-bridging protein n=1 Tax=Blattamonas nauphoetae TaxID=2049346 RepID=A0ABQ9Y5T4_9EUKA|nr:putative Branchpoint-bridging protein [Blattamonas nauphoetae]